ncbi:MAG: YkvA family protein [Cohaesibacter sp.]|nr:YkvA family protein [Cohaesibacter sp.]MCV6601450.1 YkvA family protein [Cohaesibacter sp.]
MSKTNPIRHYDEDELEFLLPEEAAKDDIGHASSQNSKKARSVRKKFWKVVKKAAHQIPIMEEVVAGYYCAFDRSTPAKVRLTLIGALAYFVLPLDFIPDFILGLGFGDDLAVLTMAIRSVANHITDEHRRKAKQALHDHMMHEQDE